MVENWARRQRQGADLVILESDPARDLMAFSRIKVTLDEDTSLFIDRKASRAIIDGAPGWMNNRFCDLREPVCEPTDPVAGPYEVFAWCLFGVGF